MKRRYKKKLFILTAAILLIAWTLWANTAPVLTRLTVVGGRLPAAFDGYRIAQVSDLHNAVLGRDNARLLRLLEKADPDLIAVTGDVIDSTRTDVGVALDFLRRAVDIAPCVFVTGNHEAWVSDAVYAELEAGMIALGISVLHDGELLLESGGAVISLVGIDDPAFAEERGGVGTSMSPDAIRALSCDPEGRYTVLLSHRPEYFDSYCRAGVDLVLSGHAHGGQFRLPLIGGLVAPDQGLFPKYDAGLFSEGDTHMIVSRGLGNSIIPLRIGNRPEVVLVELIGA